MKPAQFSFRLVALICVLAVTSPWLMAQSATDEDEGERVLTTPDGWPLRINYYESTGGKESPVVILFPGVEGKEKSMTRKVWSGVAKALHQKGYAVVTADLRKHGDSLKTIDGEPDPRSAKLTKTDYQLMVTMDLETIKAFLLAEHEKQKLNIRKLGIATAGSGCLIASAFAVNDWMKKPWADNAVYSLRTPKGQDVRAIMMLSPDSTVTGFNATLVMKALQSQAVAVHIWFNPTIASEKKSAEKLFSQLELRGTEFADARKLNEAEAEKEYSREGLLQGKAKPVMEQHIVEFFDNGLRKVESPWQTRKSRLE